MKRAIFLVVLLAGCDPAPADPDAQECSFDLQWGKMETGNFVDYRDGDTAEITLGFQGFRYVVSTMSLANAEAGARADFEFQITVDGHATYVQPRTTSPMRSGSNGMQYADDVLVFFNDIPIPELLGRQATITSRGFVGACRGNHVAMVTLVDDNSCIDESDGGVGCMAPDAGM